MLGPFQEPKSCVSAVDVIGVIHIDAHRVKLRHRKLIGVVPARPRVVGDRHSIVITHDHVPGVRRIDPQDVIIASVTKRMGPGLATVHRHIHPRAQYVEVVLVIGVDDDLAIVVGPIADAFAWRADLTPRVSGVVRAIDRMANRRLTGPLFVEELAPPGVVGNSGRVGVIDRRIENTGIPRIDVDADLPEHTAGQAVLDSSPRLPAVVGTAILLGVIAASMSAAAGVVLDLANVITRNLVQRYTKSTWGDDTMLRFSRFIALPTMAASIAFAYFRPEPGILLILAFDVVLAGCFVPMALGIYWRRSNTPGAIAAIVVGTLTRVVLYFLIPEPYAGLDTLIPPVVSLITFVTVSLVTQGTSKPKHDALNYVPTDEELVKGIY